MKIYKELQYAFDHFNTRLFNGECQPCLITLQRQANTMGYISYNRFCNIDNSNEYLHELALNPEYFGVKPLIEVCQTICHELSHLIIWQKGLDTRKTYHNSHWADLMESIGLIPSHNGRIGGRRVGQKMMDYPKPDGLFVIACNDLFMRGNIIGWYDRYYPKKTTEHHIINDQCFIDNLLGNGNTNPELLKIPVVENGKFKEITIQNHNNLIKNDPLIKELGLVNDLSINNTESNSTPKPKKPTSKNKYSCNCGNNIWGRLDLNIQCLDCNSKFIEQD